MSHASLKRLEGHVRRLRLELVGCELRCEGVQAVSRRTGHVPRIISLERGAEGGANVVVVGINPGAPDANECARVRAATNDEALVTALYEYFETNIRPRHPYYVRVRKAVRALGFGGSIMWTEAVKCSSAAEGSLGLVRTPATFRRCGGRWLQRELTTVPEDWPIIAVGRDAFAASVLLSSRRVLGIPHATAGRSPAFWRVFHGDGSDGFQLNPILASTFGKWATRKLETLMLGIESATTAANRKR